MLDSLRALLARHLFSLLQGATAGDWWRLLSTTFLHMGVLHILLNMYFLYSVGPLLERMFGPWRFLGLYAAAGLTGSCAAMVFAPNTTPQGRALNRRVDIVVIRSNATQSSGGTTP